MSSIYPTLAKPDDPKTLRGKPVSFTDQKSGLKLEFGWVGESVGKYTIKVDDVLFDDLEQAPEEEKVSDEINKSTTDVVRTEMIL